MEAARCGRLRELLCQNGLNCRAGNPSARPWLGYLMLIEEAPGSLSAVRSREPHIKVFPEFRDASYAKRYEILLTKLVRGRL